MLLFIVIAMLAESEGTPFETSRKSIIFLTLQGILRILVRTPNKTVWRPRGKFVPVPCWLADF